MVKNEKVIDMVIGTNCYNCKFIANQEKAIGPMELNEEGGIDPKNEGELERAKNADIITLPGGSKDDVVAKRYCNHKEVRMFVTVRMTCAYWDNERVRRPWN